MQGITRNILRLKPPGHEPQLEKYIKKDGAFLGDFRQQKKTTQEMILNMKLINFCGNMTLKVCCNLTMISLGSVINVVKLLYVFIINAYLYAEVIL